MGVSVRVGKHPLTVTYKRTYKDYRFPASYLEGSSVINDEGKQSKSTSPRIWLSGGRVKWSMSHSYSRSALKHELLGGTLLREWKNSKESYSYRMDGFPLTDLSIANYYSNTIESAGMPFAMSVNTQNRLITELMIKAGARKVSYGEALGESKQTINHLARTAITVGKALMAAKRGNWGAIPRLLGVRPKQLKSGTSAANRWLEYQFGWMPLINDIYDTAKVFQQGLDRPQLIRAVRRLDDGEYDFSRNSVEGGSSAYKVRGRVTANAQAIGYWRVDDVRINYLQQLGLINPAEVAWALVPFSFMIDWMVPVQTMLEATTATLGMTFIDGSLTRRASGYGELEFTKIPLMSSGNAWELISSSPCHRRRTHGIVRSPLTYAIPLPYYKSPFSSNHVVSALALLRQLTR